MLSQSIASIGNVLPRRIATADIPCENQRFFDWGHPYNPVDHTFKFKEEFIEL